MTARVALVTCRKLPDLTPDDRLLLPELAARGFQALPALWNDERIDWCAFDAVVVRSCWDYHEHPDAFRAWLDRLEAGGARVWNPVPLLRDNLHKGYLGRLAQAGVPTVPTVELARGSRHDLAALMAAHGFGRAVVKPAVSAGARRTWIVAQGDAARRQPAFDALVASDDVLVQPFMPAVATQGEWSLVFFAGVYSHAVLKTPRAGDFRVQREHGGTTRAVAPAPALVDQCRRILEQVGAPWLYARVDGLDLHGTFTLMELELIEPELFFLKDPQAASRLADALATLSAAGGRPLNA